MSDIINKELFKNYTNNNVDRIKIEGLIEQGLEDRGIMMFKKNIIADFILSENRPILIDQAVIMYDVIEYPFSMKEIIDVVLIKNSKLDNPKLINELVTDILVMILNGTIIKFIVEQGAFIFTEENIEKNFVNNKPFQSDIYKFYDEYSEYFSDRLKNKYIDWQKRILEVYPELRREV